MRWYILKALLYKEAMRHAANRGGLLLAGLLVTASLVMAALNPASEQTGPLLGGIHHCYIDVDDEHDLLTQHLAKEVPPSLKHNIVFRRIDKNASPDRLIQYPAGAGAIQIRKTSEDGKPGYLFWLWHPAGDRVGMAVYEQWFWRETYRFLHNRAADELRKAGGDPNKQFPLPDLKNDLWEKRLVTEQLQREATTLGAALPAVEWKEDALKGSALDMRAAMATALVMFALFFTCVYLMPSLTCEERERGLLLAQALSPARVREILAAKFLFYPTFGILLATLLAGIHNPAVLTRPFFWLSLVSLALGSLGIGMSIASLARTQRSASLAALCYMLVVTIVLLVCQQNNIAYVPYLAIEYHAPQMLHATLTNQTNSNHWYNLLGCAVLAVLWVMAAGFLFRRRGWQ
jgi:ABC-2 family transporter protein